MRQWNLYQLKEYENKGAVLYWLLLLYLFGFVQVQILQEAC